MTFLAAFSERPALQRRYTRFPLAYRWIEDSESGPVEVERAMPADSLRGDTLYVSAADRARQGLQVEIDSAQHARRTVTLHKPDTDYTMVYTFEQRSDQCWELTRFDNQSL